MSAFPTINLRRWVDEHPEAFTPPVMNKQFAHESENAIIFVSVGPNTRNDYHVNPTEELFYQLKGDIAVRVRPLDGSPAQDVVIREGEMFLLPSWVPHRPQRPADTIGLIVEFPRGVDEHGNPQKDRLQWYCPKNDELVHEAQFELEHIDRDLHKIMDDFWNGPEETRTCKSCGTVIQRAGSFDLEKDALPS
ncbi:MAG: 3-hydroxyanthranilate 3,4-dioxygenase [Planctomycetota bacterium]